MTQCQHASKQLYRIFGWPTLWPLFALIHCPTLVSPHACTFKLTFKLHSGVFCWSVWGLCFCVCWCLALFLHFPTITQTTVEAWCPLVTLERFTVFHSHLQTFVHSAFKMLVLEEVRQSGLRLTAQDNGCSAEMCSHLRRKTLQNQAWPMLLLLC